MTLWYCTYKQTQISTCQYIHWVCTNTHRPTELMSYVDEVAQLWHSPMHMCGCSQVDGTLFFLQRTLHGRCMYTCLQSRMHKCSTNCTVQQHSTVQSSVLEACSVRVEGADCRYAVLIPLAHDVYIYPFRYICRYWYHICVLTVFPSSSKVTVHTQHISTDWRDCRRIVRYCSPISICFNLCQIPISKFALI